MNKELVKLPFAKRAFDVVMSVFLLVISSPVFVIVAIVMILEFIFCPATRGNIFYSEIRISQGRPFRFRKFRIFKQSSLESAKNSSGIVHTKELEKDARNLTWTGGLLKQIYLDELPQLYNILIGDMTMVGPRPTNLENYQRGLHAGHRAKQIFKAGLTGYFQSHKGQNLGKTQEDLDMEYIQFVCRSPGWRVVLYDLKIILTSIRTVLRAEGI